MDLERGDVSHSSKTRSWQRLHLLELGNTFSMAACDLTESCATPRSAALPATKAPRNAAPAATSRATLLFGITVIPLLRSSVRGTIFLALSDAARPRAISS